VTDATADREVEHFRRDPTRDTHYCDWDVAGQRLVQAVCGHLIRRREHASDPTCPTCREILAARANGDSL
jgi:hypothetical protein